MAFNFAELDFALSRLPYDGSMTKDQELLKPEMIVQYRYLDAKGYVNLRYSTSRKVVGLNLTKEGIAFIHEGGFTELAYDKVLELEKEQRKFEWEMDQRKRDRKSNMRSAMIGGIVGAISGGLVGLLVSVLIK